MPTDDILENISTDASYAFLLPTGLRERNPTLDPIHQAREGQALQIDLAWSGQLGKEQTFTAKEGVLETAYKLDVVIHRGGKGHQAAGIHSQHLAALEDLLGVPDSAVTKDRLYRTLDALRPEKQELKAKGVQVDTVNRKPFVDATRSVYSKWSEGNSGGFVKQVIQAAR